MNEKYVKGGPLPKSLGAITDLYKEVEEIRLAMQKEVDAVKARATELREHLIENISKSDDRGAVGQRYKAIVKVKEKFSTKEWRDAFEWIVENDRTDMLPKSLNQGALAKYVEESGELVPGTEKVLVPELSVTKI